MRMRVRRRGPGQHHRHSSRHAEHESRDLEPGETVHSQQHGERQHQRRHDGVDDRTVDRRGHRQTVHDEDLAQYADQRRGADQFANIRPLDLLGLLPQRRHERKRAPWRRATPRPSPSDARNAAGLCCKKGNPSPRGRCTPTGPDGVSVCSFVSSFTPQRQKQCPNPHTARRKKGLPAKKAPYITQIARYRRSGIRNVAGEAPESPRRSSKPSTRPWRNPTQALQTTTTMRPALRVPDRPPSRGPCRNRRPDIRTTKPKRLPPFAPR